MGYSFIEYTTSPFALCHDPYRPGFEYRIINPLLDELPELVTIDDYVDRVFPESELENMIRQKVREGSLPVTQKTPHPDYAFVESASVDSIFCTRKSMTEIWADLIIDAEIETDGGDGRLPWQTVHVRQKYRMECILELDEKGFAFRTGRTEIYKGCGRRPGQALSKYLVPMLSRADVKKEKQKLIKIAYRNSSERQQCVRATELAERMGYTVRYAKLSKDGSVRGKAFPLACSAEVFDDDGNKTLLPVTANTILIDKAACHYSEGSIEEAIIHECVHLYEHKFFFMLQKMYHDELKSLEDLTGALPTSLDEDARKELRIIEWQANAVARETLLPEEEVREAVREIKREFRAHGLNYYGSEPELLIREIAGRFHVTQSSARNRLRMLGEKSAPGALRWIDGHYARCFHTSDYSYDPDKTYLISARDAIREFGRNPQFRDAVRNGGYIFVENFFCKNDSRYVRRMKDRVELTPYALNHINECCLAFTVIFGDTDAEYDPDALHLNARTVKPYVAYSSMDSRQRGNALNAFIKTRQGVSTQRFGPMLGYYMKDRGYTSESLSEALNLSVDTVKGYRSGRIKVSKPVLTAICVVLHLEPSVSKDLFDFSDNTLRDSESIDDTIYTFIIGTCYDQTLGEVDKMLSEAGRPPLLSMK